MNFRLGNLGGLEGKGSLGVIGYIYRNVEKVLIFELFFELKDNECISKLFFKSKIWVGIKVK